MNPIDPEEIFNVVRIDQDPKVSGMVIQNVLIEKAFHIARMQALNLMLTLSKTGTKPVPFVFDTEYGYEVRQGHRRLSSYYIQSVAGQYPIEDKEESFR